MSLWAKKGPFMGYILSRTPRFTTKRYPITVQNNETSQIANFVVQANFGNSSWLTYKSVLPLLCNCNSVRITDQAGNNVPFYPRIGALGVCFDFKVTIAGSTTATYYLYYDGYAGDYAYTGTDVYYFFDDFPGSSLDTTTNWDSSDIVIGGSGSWTITVADSCAKCAVSGPTITRLLKTGIIASTDANYAVGWVTKVATRPGYADYGVAFRYTDTSNWYMHNVDYWDNGYRIIGFGKRVGGGYTPISGDMGYNDEIDAWNDNEIEMVGTAYKMWTNGFLLKSGTDSSITQGRVGLLADDEYGGSGTYWYDHLRIRKTTTNMPTVTIGTSETVRRHW